MSLSSVKVLVIDDDPHVLQQWHLMLQTLEFEVITANHSSTAFELAQQYQPDFILSDIDMPDIDGFQLLEQLKQTSRTSHIPVIICSGTTDQTSKFLALTLGATAYLRKPLNIEAFTDIVAEHSLSTTVSA